MAQISVTELMFDLDFCDPVTVQRQVMTIGNDGNAVYQPVTINILASIQPSGSDTLEVQPDSSRTEAHFEIITAFPLVAATDITGADVIVWDQRQFRVVSIDRLGNFTTGNGHFEAVMELMSISPVPLDAQ
jgi:hypothetical protein